MKTYKVTIGRLKQIIEFFEKEQPPFPKNLYLINPNICLHIIKKKGEEK